METIQFKAARFIIDEVEAELNDWQTLIHMLIDNALQ